VEELERGRDGKRVGGREDERDAWREVRREGGGDTKETKERERGRERRWRQIFSLTPRPSLEKRHIEI
jgi:hypothetical protein